MKKRSIVAIPLWFMTDAPVTSRHRVAHVTYYDSGAVCGADFHGSASAVLGTKFKKCDRCIEWLRAKGDSVPAVAATFVDTTPSQPVGGGS